MEFRPLGLIRHARLAGSLLSWNFIMGECLLFAMASMGHFRSLRRTIGSYAFQLIAHPCDFHAYSRGKLENQNRGESCSTGHLSFSTPYSQGKGASN
ncbi:uncharacterized protein LOC143208885 isoform X2 [Lasioglossum baleicum]|uniref:uncharacterized protein LOC143208885 isoform X2 n=1 Tax=Lasioglossum baleicum TaxID=434251 RepID=UPI003FCE5C2E